MDSSVFNAAHYVEINKKREAWLSGLLKPIIASSDLSTAIDVGCGEGYFSHFLHQLGLKVVSIDGRRTNVEKAREKYPMLQFLKADIEDATKHRDLGSFDLVLCLGLLYHLENPFRAERNLCALTNQYLIIESIVVPSKLPISILYEEVKSRDQSLDFIALIPSIACLVKMLYKSGFKNVYRTINLPDHRDFKTRIFGKQARTCLVASKSDLNFKQMKLIPVKNLGYHDKHFSWFRKMRILKQRIYQMVYEKEY